MIRPKKRLLTRLKMANSSLYNKTSFTIPNNVLRAIQGALSKYGNANGSERAKNLLNSPKISYMLAKKIKNYFDNFVSHNGSEATFELYGGKEMKNWLNNSLGNTRGNLVRSKTVRANGGFENEFRKEHDKTSIKPSKLNTSSLMLPKIKRMELFESIMEDEADMKNVAAISVIFNLEGKFLIVRRTGTDTWMPNKWALVGGGIKIGEDIDEALTREIKEETNLVVENIIYSFSAMEDKTKVYIFMAKCPEPSEIVLDTHEHDEHAWVSIEECSNYETVPLVKEYVIKALLGFKEEMGKEKAS
jgi:8-oxo-dGTP diphosphatase